MDRCLRWEPTGGRKNSSVAYTAHTWTRRRLNPDPASKPLAFCCSANAVILFAECLYAGSGITLGLDSGRAAADYANAPVLCGAEHTDSTESRIFT
jgi:hypothetical protein